MTIFSSRTALAVCAALLLVACNQSKHMPVQDLGSGEYLSSFKLHSLAGTRDGEKLHAQAVFSDSSSILTVELHFAIGSPTTLESGKWSWPRGGQLLTGAAASKSVTFLGGQDGPPSIGGTFDLLSVEGTARYRVTIPVTQLKTRFNLPAR